MDYRIIFLDIDGTLTNSQKAITKPTLDTLIGLQERGVVLAVASGRPDPGVLPIAHTLRLDEFGGYTLSYNGAKVKNLKTGETVFENSLSLEAFRLAYALSKQYHVDLITYDDDSIVSEASEGQYLELESRVNGMPIKVVPSTLDYVDYRPTKCLMLGDGDYLATVEPKVRDALRGLANVYRSEPFFLEVVPLGVDKAVAISELIRTLGIKRSETMAFGDGYNDVSMVEYVACGVAMANGCDAIKERADYVTLSNDRDGIVHFLSTLDWN